MRFGSLDGIAVSMKYGKSAPLRECSVPVTAWRIRTQLVAQRPIFYEFARPGFVLNFKDMTEGAYANLSGLFGRAVYEVEEVREVVIGSVIIQAIGAFAAAKYDLRFSGQSLTPLSLRIVSTV